MFQFELFSEGFIIIYRLSWYTFPLYDHLDSSNFLIYISKPQLLNLEIL
jgi:hypothetical protein